MASEKRNLIDREKLKSTIRNMVELPNEVRAQVLGAVSRAKAADAVEVVRCKDCQNCKVAQMSIPGDYLSRQFPMYVCKHPRGEVGTDPLYMEADDFCSYGERRDGE